MPTIKFLTRTQKKNILAPLYVRLYETKLIDFSIKTDTRVYPIHWNEKKQRFNERINYSDSFDKNDQIKIETTLNDLKNHILKEYNNRVISGQPITKDWLVKSCDKFYNRSSRNENLNQYIERFIAEIEKGVRLSKRKGNENKKYAPGTIKNFKGFESQFLNFQESKHVKLNFNDIDIDFYNNFVLFFNEKNYSPNTIGRMIKSLKIIMRAARNEGLHSNSQIDLEAFKITKVDVQNIYLNESEIKRLFDLDLSENRTLEIARDVFLIGCYTAQRFSDYSTLTPDNLRVLPNGLKALFITQKKTSEQVVVPMRSELEFLLKKYDYNVPKIWEQKLNFHIKNICEMVDINDPIKIESIKGGLKVSQTVSKNMLVKTHTARRSGCTNMYLAGIPAIDIMKISGHKTPTEFLKYIKVGKEETAQNLTNHPYFNNSPLKVAK